MYNLKDNSYYLVALPRGEVLKWASRFQQEVAGRYDIYEKPYPPIHITLGIIYPEDKNELQKAVNVLDSVLKKTRSFHVIIKGSSCFAPPYKSLNLSVERTLELESIAENIYYNLNHQNIAALCMRDWDFHISLVNTVFARREWTLEEFHEACYLLESRPMHLTCDITRLQLWSPHFPPLNIVASFKLLDT